MKATDKMRRLWAAAKKKCGASSYEIAVLVSEFLAKAKGDHKVFAAFMTDDLFEESEAVRKYLAMAVAVREFSDQSDWSALGFRGLQILATVPEKDRAAAMKAVRAHIIQGAGVVGPKKIREAVEAFLPKSEPRPERATRLTGGPHPAVKLEAVAKWLRDVADIRDGFLWLPPKISLAAIPADVVEALALDKVEEPVEA